MKSSTPIPRERKQKILADREAAKKAKEDKQNENKEENKNNN